MIASRRHRKHWTPMSLGPGVLMWLRADRGYTLNATMPTPTATGTATIPTLSLSGSPTTPIDLRIECVSGGARGTATYRASMDGGTSWLATAVTAATVTVGPLTVTMGTGTYVSDQVWISRAQYSALTDLSGAGNSVTQASSALQPRAKYVGGRLHMVFDTAAKQFLRTGAFTKPTSYTVMAMGTKDTAAAVSQWLCGSNGPTGSSVACWGVIGSQTAGELQYSFSNGAASATTYRTSTTPLVDAQLFSFLTGYQTGQATQSINYSNGVSQTMAVVASAGSTALGGTAYQFGVGCLGEYAASETWGGTIREIVVVNRQLSTSEALNLVRYSKAWNGA